MFDHEAIEKKWQKYWEDNKTFKTDAYDFSKPKYYALDMFPYPSGVGLHAGHPEGYTATDIVCRMKRMQGYNVLHPMGFDSFGLPAEQYAIQTGHHPEKFTKDNIETFRKQLKMLGFSYDWDREISTSDPNFYKWTQWIFKQLFDNGLAKCVEMPVNWCEELGTVLANDEVIDGKSERGGYPVVRMPMRQWVLKITAYAERLEKDLSLLDWPKSTLEMQKNWIGRSTGVQITFKIKGHVDSFDVFTTRVDTLFGCTYCCLAPEHPLVAKLVSAKQKKEVEAYVKKAAAKSDLLRTSLEKEKTGVYLGVEAINPINGAVIPVYVADYVLGSYGTGAVMAVPSGDERDYEFAKLHHLPMIKVIDADISSAAYEGDGKHVNSSFADGLDNEEAKAAITKKLVSLGAGKEVVNYKLRDWIFSRQRYWGEPIPVVTTKDGKELPIPEDQLPLVLPELDDYQPTRDGKPPLSKAPDSWLHPTLNGEKVTRETNTMPQWAGSCWYYIRYLDPHNEQAMADPKLIEHWLPVDLYIGGQEHAVLHLLYARFWHKFLYDIGVVKCPEPFQKLYHQGMILGSNGEKMSKSRGNVINPDDIVQDYGADSLRLFEMFAGPLSEVKPWSTTGLEGARRFLERAYRLVSDPDFAKKISSSNSGELDYSYNALVKKATSDYESLSFNTTIAQMMVFVNDCYKANSLYQPYLEGFTQILSCVCPFLGEEMWSLLGHTESIAYAKWPTYDESKLTLTSISIAVAVNGKPRDVISVDPNAEEEELEKLALAAPKVQSYLAGHSVKKVIVVKGRIVNLIVA